MRNPRVFTSPNGGLLNVEVSSLRQGLSKCRSIAEHVITTLQNENECDVMLAMETIIEEARRALTTADDERALDEVGALLKERHVQNGKTKE